MIPTSPARRSFPARRAACDRPVRGSGRGPISSPGCRARAAAVRPAAQRPPGRVGDAAAQRVRSLAVCDRVDAVQAEGPRLAAHRNVDGHEVANLVEGTIGWTRALGVHITARSRSRSPTPTPLRQRGLGARRSILCSSRRERKSKLRPGKERVHTAATPLPSHASCSPCASNSRASCGASSTGSLRRADPHSCSPTFGPLVGPELAGSGPAASDLPSGVSENRIQSSQSQASARARGKALSSRAWPRSVLARQSRS